MQHFLSISTLREATAERSAFHEVFTDALTAAAEAGTRKLRVVVQYGRAYPNGSEDRLRAGKTIDVPADSDPEQVAARAVDALARAVGEGFRGHVVIAFFDGDGPPGSREIAPSWDRYVEIPGPDGANPWTSGPDGGGYPGAPSTPGGYPAPGPYPGAPGYGYLPPGYTPPGYQLGPPPGYAYGDPHNGGYPAPPAGTPYMGQLPPAGSALGPYSDGAPPSLSAEQVNLWVATMEGNERRLDGERSQTRAMVNAVIAMMQGQQNMMTYFVYLSAMQLGHAFQHSPRPDPGGGGGFWGFVQQTLGLLAPGMFPPTTPQVPPPPRVQQFAPPSAATHEWQRPAMFGAQDGPVDYQPPPEPGAWGPGAEDYEGGDGGDGGDDGSGPGAPGVPAVVPRGGPPVR